MIDCSIILKSVEAVAVCLQVWQFGMGVQSDQHLCRELMKIQRNVKYSQCHIAAA